MSPNMKLEWEVCVCACVCVLHRECPSLGVDVQFLNRPLCCPALSTKRGVCLIRTRVFFVRDVEITSLSCATPPDMSTWRAFFR